MAARGAKPKPTHLRIVDGTHRTPAFGKLTQPKHLKGDAARGLEALHCAGLLAGRIARAAAIAFCELWQEFRFCPTGFAAAKHGQLRAYMSELGLTDERNRGGDDDKDKDEFFD
jgi:hypothetical protein